MTKKKLRSVDREMFVDSKAYLVACLIIYLLSLFIVDHFGDSLSFKIRDLLMNLFNRDQGFFVVKRLFIWDILVGVIFCGIVVPSAMYLSPSFIFFNGIVHSHEENLWISFLRVFRNCLLTSLILIAFFAIVQGLLWWVPDIIVGIYLQEYYPEMRVRKEDQIIYEHLGYFGLWLKSINFSLIFLSLIRIGILFRIIKNLIHFKKKYKAINFFALLAVLFSLIFCAAKYIESQQYQGTTKMKYQDDKSDVQKWVPFQKRDDKKVNNGVAVDDDVIQELPRARITVYDPVTGETTTNESEYQHNQ